jgi:hypothetical protein
MPEPGHKTKRPKEGGAAIEYFNVFRQMEMQ